MAQTTAQRVALLLNRDRFRHWLKEQPSEYFAGEFGQPNSCPIAKYLRSKGISARVYSSQIEVDASASGVALPDWACDFIHDVDVREADPTVAEALAILEMLA